MWLVWKTHKKRWLTFWASLVNTGFRATLKLLDLMDLWNLDQLGDLQSPLLYWISLVRTSALFINSFHSALLLFDAVLQNSAGLYIIVVFSITLAVCNQKITTKKKEVCPKCCGESIAGKPFASISQAQQTSIINNQSKYVSYQNPHSFTSFLSEKLGCVVYSPYWIWERNWQLRCIARNTG